MFILHWYTIFPYRKGKIEERPTDVFSIAPDFFEIIVQDQRTSVIKSKR